MLLNKPAPCDTQRLVKREVLAQHQGQELWPKNTAEDERHLALSSNHRLRALVEKIWYKPYVSEWALNAATTCVEEHQRLPVEQWCALQWRIDKQTVECQ